MPPQSSALRLFFAIPEEEVERDIGNAMDRVEELQASLGNYFTIPRKARKPDQTARFFHDQMIATHALIAGARNFEDVDFFQAIQAGETIANEAAFDAHYKSGQLCELDKQMADMRAQHGVDAEEWEFLEDAPPQYQALNQMYDALSEKISDTVLIEVLTRYEFFDVAEALEMRPIEAGIRREVGRRISFGEPVDEAPGTFHTGRWGKEGMAFFNSRVEAYRNYVAEQKSRRG